MATELSPRAVWTTIAAVVSVVCVGAAVYLRSGEASVNPAAGDQPLVVKGDHTLDSLAREVANPAALSYDPTTRTAVCNRNLTIEGKLRLGEAGKPEAGQTLQMNTLACGTLEIRVAAGAELALYDNSTLTTLVQVSATAQCPKGYALHVAGRLTAQNANIDFMSGSMSESLAAGATADIRNSAITRGDGGCLRLHSPDNRSIRIEGCTLAVNAGWSVTVFADKPADEPFLLRDCTFKAQSGPVSFAGSGARVDLLDCLLGANRKFAFNDVRGDAQARILWTTPVTVRAAGADGSPTPLAGAEVIAESESGAGVPASARAVTDANGTARLVLTDWTATAGSPDPAAANRSGPYRVRVVRDGKTVAEGRAEARGRGVPLELTAAVR